MGEGYILEGSGYFFHGKMGVFFSRQDAGLLPAKPDSGNCLAFYCRLFKTFTPTRTDPVFCLSRRQ
jgi:hypothetical protein